MFSLSYSNIWFASGLGLSSLCGCQQEIKRGTYEPAVRLRNFTEQVLLWGKREWVGTFPKECLPVWYHCYGNLKLEDKPGRPVKCKWQEAQESSYLLTPYRASKDKMSEFLPFVKTSFPGVLKAKLPCRRKGQESSRGKVTDLNPQNHLRCLLWKQILTQKWQKQQTGLNSKTSENHVFCPSTLANWIGSTHRGRARAVALFCTSSFSHPFEPRWLEMTKTSCILMNSHNIILKSQEETFFSSKVSGEMQVVHCAVIC